MQKFILRYNTVQDSQDNLKSMSWVYIVNMKIQVMNLFQVIFFVINSAIV